MADNIIKFNSQQPIVEAENLRYSYRYDEEVEGDTASEEKELVALNDLSVSIRKGEFVSVIGQNGCGKSTFAKHLNALLKADSGKLLVVGLDASDDENVLKIRSSCGMVFQNPDNQIVASIVEEDVAFGPENLGLPTEEIRKRVDTVLQSVGMYEFLEYAPNYLSGGQKQRIAIAGVLAMKPQVIVLDEPTAMLDPMGRKAVMDTVHRLNEEEGITIINITHFMEEAAESDRVILMSNGSIVSEGTPEEIFDNVELLHELKLDVPAAAELAGLLRKDGFDLPKGLVKQAELVEALCQYR